MHWRTVSSSIASSSYILVRICEYLCVVFLVEWFSRCSIQCRGVSFNHVVFALMQHIYIHNILVCSLFVTHSISYENVLVYIFSFKLLCLLLVRKPHVFNLSSLLGYPAFLVLGFFDMYSELYTIVLCIFCV